MALEICKATEADLPLLARMNKRLIDDEDSPNPMSVAELEERMRGWLRQGIWKIVFFKEEQAVLGYATYRRHEDEYRPDQEVIYLRQFYIEREYRRKRLGTRAFRELTRAHFPAGCIVTLDVLTVNPNGFHFWSSLGLQPYSTTMKLKT